MARPTCLLELRRARTSSEEGPGRGYARPSSGRQRRAVRRARGSGRAPATKLVRRVEEQEISRVEEEQGISAWKRSRGPLTASLVGSVEEHRRVPTDEGHQ